MSPPTVSKAQTSYPIYAATFANNKPSVLLVGGGGGAGKHGVKNKITAFDFSSRAPTVEPVAEIEASEDDSVACLANLATKDGLILYAGINGSEAERLADKNEHFRAFEVRFPQNKQPGNMDQEKTPQGKISFMSKTALFNAPSSTNDKKDIYQRVLRLSPPQRTASKTPSKRIGAIASSLAGDENEIVIFSATSNKPQNPGDVVQRITLNKRQEANDLDILDQGDGQFQLAYVTDYDVYVQDVKYDFSARKNLANTNSRRKLYSVPHPDFSEKKGRPKVRCIRWLSPTHILLLANKPNRSGVELYVLRLYEDGPGSIIMRKTLPKHAKAAVDMDVSLLDADSDGAYQTVIAVAAIDLSLLVYTIDYHGRDQSSLSRLHHFATYREVHPNSITKAVFSPFFAPDTSPGKQPGLPYLRLASTSMGNTVSVETFELQRLSSKPNSRHVLQTARSRTVNQATTSLLFAVIAAVIAILALSLVDPAGNLTKNLVPESLRHAASRFRPPGEVAHEARLAAARQVPEAVKSPIAEASQRISDLLNLPHENAGEQKAVIVRHDPDMESSLSTEVHAGTEEVVKRHTEARKWEELSHSERKRWKQKLIDAGMWAVEEGETILKGIFFSEAGALVGQVAQGVMHG
ncbi:hypothetical protein BDV95DRAFT_543325 [Massariosphaeria phaeospora]|uniref:Guanine nucleotide-exchange factor SEC12 n=1 Tax=Massariosphaeria phaeospora TaxID=100035 RepID=A0A7C8I8D9_9PLEO|nr:hypothetical protein BDV95DRAFT_543325 [Massariosphaeria phaeospora]